MVLQVIALVNDLKVFIDFALSFDEEDDCHLSISHEVVS
jgi:hypothetical protein